MVVTTRTWAGAREPGTARNGARRACHRHERNNWLVVLSYLLEATYHRSESQRLKLEGAADALAAQNDLLDMRLDCGDDILPDVFEVVGHLHVDIAGVGQDLVDLDVEVDAATRSELVACCDFVRTAGRVALS
jgi:hypothetical protein